MRAPPKISLACVCGSLCRAAPAAHTAAAATTGAHGGRAAWVQGRTEQGVCAQPGTTQARDAAPSEFKRLRRAYGWGFFAFALHGAAHIHQHSHRQTFFCCCFRVFVASGRAVAKKIEPRTAALQKFHPPGWFTSRVARVMGRLWGAQAGCCGAVRSAPLFTLDFRFLRGVENLVGGCLRRAGAVAAPPPCGFWCVCVCAMRGVMWWVGSGLECGVG